MKKIFYYFVALLVTCLALPAIASTLPATPAVFETYLSTPMSTTDTSLTLASASLRDGTSLSGYYCFTIDTNTPTLEYVCGTASGTSVTGLTRGIGAVSGTTTYTALAYSHRRGADIKITDYPVLTLIQRTLSGIDTIASKISYTSHPTFTNSTELVDKKYVDDTAFSGAGVINATEGARGVVQLATQLQQASSTATSGGNPIVLQAKYSTSTYNPATAPLSVVVTRNDGRIDPNFIATSTAMLSNLALSGTTTVNSVYPFGMLNSLDLNNISVATSTTFANHDFLKFNVYGSTTNSTTNYCLVLNGDYSTANYSSDNSLGTTCTNGIGGINLNTGLAGERFWWEFKVQNATGTAKMIIGTGIVKRNDKTLPTYATSTTIYSNYSTSNSPVTQVTFSDGGSNLGRLVKAYVRTYSDGLPYSTP